MRVGMRARVAAALAASAVHAATGPFEDVPTPFEGLLSSALLIPLPPANLAGIAA